MQLPIIVVLSTHLCIVSDALLPGLSANDRPTHSTRNQPADGNQNGSSQNDVGPPRHVRHEEEHIDQEAQEANQEGEDAKDEQG